MIKISVIIPVYNVEKYLRKTLNSIINQTLKDIEIICIDDGSTDKSLEILQEYKENDNRFIILTQQNQYAGIARNKGLEIAKGKYLSFLDSDDFFEPEMLEYMYNQAEKDDSDIVTCGWKLYDDKTTQIRDGFKINSQYLSISPFSPKDIAKDLFTFCSPNPWTKLFKRELFIKNNLLFENTICCNDLTCICTALALAKRISAVDKQFVYYRVNQTSNLTANRNKNLKCFLQAIQNLYTNLIKFNLYDCFEKAFISRIQTSLKWEASLCSPQQNNERREYAKIYLSDKLYNLLYNSTKVKANIKTCKKFIKY